MSKQITADELAEMLERAQLHTTWDNEGERHNEGLVAAAELVRHGRTVDELRARFTNAPDGAGVIQVLFTAEAQGWI